jgi:hypothetical protein
MTGLDRWMRRQAEREGRAVYLEEVLLSGRFSTYAFYRLRFFLLRYVAESVLHGAKFAILFIAFEGWLFAAVVLAGAGAGLISSFWWGALEVMRARVRHLARSGRQRRIPEEIGSFFWLAGFLAAASLLGAAAWIAFSLLWQEQTLRVFHLYVGAVALRLALDLCTLTFHSGAYAIRRIYRPLPALLAVEGVGLMAMVGAWPLVGSWSIPVATAVSAVVSAALTIHYTARLYRFLLWLPLRLSLRSSLGRIRRIAWGEFLSAGASYAVMRLDAFLVLALFTAGADGDRPGDLFVLFYVLSPTVRAGFDWAQLFYFDLKRLETARFENLRVRYERFLERLALGLGLGFGAVAWGIGFLVLFWNVGLAGPLLVPFFLSRSALAFAQIRAFSTRRYLLLLSSGGVLLAGLFAIGALVEQGWVKLLALTAVTTIVLLSIRKTRDRRSGDEAPAQVLAPLDWVRALTHERGPLRIREGRLSARPARTADPTRPPSENETLWALNRAASRIGRRIGRGGAVTALGPDRIAWFERGAGEGRVGTEWLFAMGGGMWKSVEAPTPAELLRGWTSGEASSGEEALLQSFQALCPGGRIFAPDGPLPRWLDDFSSRDRRSVLADAEYFADRLRPRTNRGPFEITALCAEGELKLVFLAPRRGSPRRRARFVSLVRAANLAAAIDRIDASLSPASTGAVGSAS